jgi:hypothetical protein
MNDVHTPGELAIHERLTRAASHLHSPTSTETELALRNLLGHLANDSPIMECRRGVPPFPDRTALDAPAVFDIQLDQRGPSHVQGRDGINLDPQRNRGRRAVLVGVAAAAVVAVGAGRRAVLVGVAAAAVVAVGAVAVLQWGDDWSPADEQVTGAPPPATPEEFARGFVDAWAGFDADRALSYLSEDAVAAEWGTEEEFRLWLSLLDAVDAETLNIACEQHGDSAAGTVVRCTYDDHMLGSDEMGLGPYSGNYWDLTIGDGTVVSAAQGSHGPDLFSEQIWDPFRRWVAAEHPDDVAVMYDGSRWRISEESIPLWDQHTAEYVEARVGFVGLPPEGAQPSTLQRSEKVFTIYSCEEPIVLDVLGAPHQAVQPSTLSFFADGRLVWLRNADIPQGANPLSTGWLEQRLTPEGVELMRAELLASGLLREDGSELAELDCAAGEIQEQIARLMDPGSWLPASAWEDREIRAYVPSQYQISVGETGLGRSAPSELLEAELSAAAEELVLAKEWAFQTDGGAVWYYTVSDVTTDEARLLADALDDAGFEQDQQASPYQLEYNNFDLEDRPVRVVFNPLLPDLDALGHEQ